MNRARYVKTGKNRKEVEGEAVMKKLVGIWGGKGWAELSSIHFCYSMIAAGYPRISPDHLCSLRIDTKITLYIHIYIQ